jgi:hypothetical protein
MGLSAIIQQARVVVGSAERNSKMVVHIPPSPTLGCVEDRLTGTERRIDEQMEENNVLHTAVFLLAARPLTRRHRLAFRQ